MNRLTERSRGIITGLIAVTLSLSVLTIGINFSFGEFDGGYRLTGAFSAAGQGLQSGSDVKIRGVNVGRVEGVDLVDGQALVKMRISEGREIPVTATASVLPKTLFGEKFIDIRPGPDERNGPFLGPDEAIVDTVGAIELQRVFDEAFPLVEAIDPAELMLILSTLADASEGTGEIVNRTIDNFEKVLDVTADHDDDTRRFLDDLARLSGSLADAADDIVEGAKDLNVALPDLNSRSGALSTLLDQAARLSADAADLIEENKGFFETNIVEGGKTLDLLSSRVDDVGPLVFGLRQFLQTLSDAIRIPAIDGTLLAAVKQIVGEEGIGVSVPLSAAAPEPGETGSTSLDLPLPRLFGLPAGAEAISQLLSGILAPFGGPR